MEIENLTDFSDTNAVSAEWNEHSGGYWLYWIGPFGVNIKSIGAER